MMVRYFAPALTRLGVLMAHPAAFLVLARYIGAWLVLVWLPAGPLSSPGAPHFAERAVGEATLLGARYRYTQVFRFDSALSPSNVPRPTSHGWCHPEDDR